LISRYGPAAEENMPHCRRIFASASLLPLLLLVSSPAGATYSIVATDSATQAVGGSVTSCVGAGGVLIVYGPAPGYGGINAQAKASAAGRDRGDTLLTMGVAPADIITQITSPSFDTDYNNRQYGVADLQGRAAAFTGTGPSVAQWRGSKQGTLGTYTYSVQGNVLTGPAVVDQAEAAFRSGGCDLAEKLMLALEGGAQNSQGDARCINDAGVGVPANAASIEVDLTGQPAGSYLMLSNAQNGSVNAVVQLRSQFNTWRQTHACLQQDGGTPDAGSKDASVTDVIADARDGGDVSIGSDASDGSAGTGGTAGAAGQGGTAGTGGAAGSSGTAGSGGAAGTGGATGGAGGAAGGAAGKGGAAGTSGSGGMAGTATGGSTGTGGGGASGSAGAGGSTAGNAGTSATGGRAGAGASGGASGSAGSTSDDGGCSCRTVPRGGDGRARSALSALLGMIAAMRSRRAKRRRDAH
jgi:uncharacterized Ntn-hydrolase superfamily protein